MRKRNFICSTLIAVSTCMLTGLSMTAAAASDLWSSTTSRNADNNICIDFTEIEVVLPASWAGKCQMGTSENSVSFYHKDSRELYTQELGYPNGGHLFTVSCEQAPDFSVLPNYYLLGSTESGTYYVTQPSDFQGYANNEEVCNEFRSMSEDVQWIMQNISFTTGEAQSWPAAGTDDEYIFPQSSTSALSENDLSGLSADQIQMAINEIYARHHRKFVIQSIQDYFNSKSWYSGYVEAADFDVSVMNQVEGQNINLMVKCLSSRSQENSGQPADKSQNTKDAYGMIIESGSGYFKVRLEDGSVIQFWYDSAKFADMGLSSDALKTGAITSLIYDADSYEALSILVW